MSGRKFSRVSLQSYETKYDLDYSFKLEGEGQEWNFRVFETMINDGRMKKMI